MLRSVDVSDDETPFSLTDTSETKTYTLAFLKYNK